jgi:hypothetical protein
MASRADAFNTVPPDRQDRAKARQVQDIAGQAQGNGSRRRGAMLERPSVPRRPADLERSRRRLPRFRQFKPGRRA